MPRPIIITAGIISSKIRYISISRADLPTNTRTHRHWWKIAISSLPVLSFQSHHPRQTRQAPSFRQAGYRCRDRNRWPILAMMLIPAIFVLLIHSQC
jgi:hypothetical protein